MGASGGRAVCARSKGAANVHSKIASTHELFPITGPTSINVLFGGILGKRASLVAAANKISDRCHNAAVNFFLFRESGPERETISSLIFTA
jgi:hypothetical protein